MHDLIWPWSIIGFHKKGSSGQKVHRSKEQRGEWWAKSVRGTQSTGQEGCKQPWARRLYQCQAIKWCLWLRKPWEGMQSDMLLPVYPLFQISQITQSRQKQGFLQKSQSVGIRVLVKRKAGLCWGPVPHDQIDWHIFKAVLVILKHSVTLIILSVTWILQVIYTSSHIKEETRCASLTLPDVLQGHSNVSCSHQQSSERTSA